MTDFITMSQRCKELIALADSRVRWKSHPPNASGFIWFGAKWQNVGYYHVQRYKTTDSIAYLKRQPDEWWFGPLTKEMASQRWTHFIRCRDYFVTVCDSCLMASCWHGTFMCQNSINAGTVEKPASSLLAMNLEHKDYFSPDTIQRVCGSVQWIESSPDRTSTQ